MLKYVLLGLLVIWLFYSPMVRQLIKGKSSTPKPQRANSKPAVMLSCDHCGAHFPEDEAVTVSHAGHTHHFCCKEHMQQGPRRPH